MKKLSLLLVLALLLVSVPQVLATPQNTVEYTGQGFDGEGMLESEKCDEFADLGQDKDFIIGPDGGYLKWVLTAAGAESATITGPWGTFEMIQAGGGAFHKATDYYPVDVLISFPVTATWVGSVQGSVQLVVSNGCPGGFEDLDVSKTAATYFERTHEWDIDKKVETEFGYELDGTPKIWLFVNGSGDETATWTVDVSYEGYEDSEFNVSGEITIENTGTLDAVITSILDELAGEEIAIDCGVIFPYTLPVGETLTCVYSEDGYVEGFNEVTVTTERDEYFADAEIIWGDPDEEFYATVSIKDISDLFGTVALGTVTAPNGDTFTYDKDFAWGDYGQDNCGPYLYGNLAKIVETGQTDSASLKVNVQCVIFDGQTAWAANGELPGSLRYTNRGNWATYVEYAEKTTSLFAGKTMLAGYVTFSAVDDGWITITVALDGDWDFEDMSENLKVQDYEFAPSGNPAPGLFDWKDYAGGDSFSIMVPTNNFYGVHVNVGKWVPDPNFGP